MKEIFETMLSGLVLRRRRTFGRVFTQVLKADAVPQSADETTRRLRNAVGIVLLFTVEIAGVAHADQLSNRY